MAQPFPVEKITDEVTVVHGPVNGVLIERRGETLAIYGDPRPEPAKAGQIRSVRITKLDQANKKIEVELAG